MQVKLKHLGYCPPIKRHIYQIILPDGKVDMIYEAVLITAGSIELDDRLYLENSGWVNIKCNGCDSEFRERVFPGMVFKCPICETEEVIPEIFEKESSNYV